MLLGVWCALWGLLGLLLGPRHSSLWGFVACYALGVIHVIIMQSDRIAAAEPTSLAPEPKKPSELA